MTSLPTAQVVTWRDDPPADAYPIVLWELDPERSAFRFVSPAAVAMFGFPLASWEQPEWFWRELVHPDDRDVVRAHWTSATRDGVGHGARYRCVTADGRVLCVEHTVHVVMEDGPASAPRRTLRGALLDVSEWRRADRRLRQAQRLEVIGRLTGGVAHDFNNVLTAVRLYSELLLDALRGDAPPQADALQRDVEEIRRAADRASALTRQLLSFSRVDAPDAQPLDVGAAVAALTPMLRRLISARVALEVEQPNVTAVTIADPGQLEQIVLNLCVNARDAMPNGGTLTVTTRAAMVRDDRQWVTLAVRDTGTGMDAATRARAFEPFFTTKAAGEGTGLGLATVAEIVREGGGYVELDSTVGEGTTVTIWLRQLEGLAAESRDPLRVPNVVTPLAQHGTILLVEDEPAVRAGLRRVLVRHGYALLEAGNGAEALAISDAYDGRIHLVLTDLVMPEMGGAELAELLAVRRPDTPVVFVSGYASDVAVVGENAFVPKPVSSADVLRVVHAALATVSA